MQVEIVCVSGKVLSGAAALHVSLYYYARIMMHAAAGIPHYSRARSAALLSLSRDDILATFILGFKLYAAPAAPISSSLLAFSRLYSLYIYCVSSCALTI